MRNPQLEFVFSHKAVSVLIHLVHYHPASTSQSHERTCVPPPPPPPGERVLRQSLLRLLGRELIKPLRLVLPQERLVIILRVMRLALRKVIVTGEV